MTNGTSGDERHRRVPAGLAFSCEGSSDALWANNQFQIRKRFTASELFSRLKLARLPPHSLLPSQLYLLSRKSLSSIPGRISRRIQPRFSGVDFSPCPGTLAKIIGKWSDTQKSLLRQSFFENRGIKIRLHSCT